MVKVKEGEYAGIALLIILVLAIGAVFVQAWIFMLIAGGLSTFIEWIPPFGYGESLLIVLGLNFLAGIFRSVR
jgi:hypothetical protein